MFTFCFTFFQERQSCHGELTTRSNCLLGEFYFSCCVMRHRKILLMLPISCFHLWVSRLSRFWWSFNISYFSPRFVDSVSSSLIALCVCFVLGFIFFCLFIIGKRRNGRNVEDFRRQWIDCDRSCIIFFLSLAWSLAQWDCNIASGGFKACFWRQWSYQEYK